LRYAFIAEQCQYYTVTRLCDVMKVSRRGYYDWLNRPPSAREVSNQRLLIEIKRVFYAYREVYGAPRIYHTLLEEGQACGLNRVARLMQETGLVPKTVKKFRVTTDSRQSHRPAPNRLERDFSASRPNEPSVRPDLSQTGMCGVIAFSSTIHSNHLCRTISRITDESIRF